MRNSLSSSIFFCSTNKNVHQIVVSPRDQRHNENNLENAVILRTELLPPTVIPKPLEKTLKFIGVPTAAVFSSLSLAIFIIVGLSQKYNDPDNIPAVPKILLPAVPELLLIAFRMWLINNYIGKRMNFRADADIQQSDDTFEEAPQHVLASLVAILSNFTDAGLVAHAGLAKSQPVILWGGTIVLGTLNYITSILIEAAPAFRKHAEHRQKYGQKIKPFFQQNYIKTLMCGYPEYLARIIREILPCAKGIIQALVVTQTTTAYTGRNKAMNIVNLFLGLTIYAATAWSTRFELAQIRDNLEAATGNEFLTENIFSRCGVPPLRWVGKALSGQLLMDALKRIKLSTATCVNLMLAFRAIGVMATLQKAWYVYLISDNREAITAGQEGIVMRYCVGTDETVRLALSAEYILMAISISLGVLSTFARAATLHKEAHRMDAQVLPVRIAVINDDLGEDSHNMHIR